MLLFDRYLWQPDCKYFRVKLGRKEPAKIVLLGETFEFLGVSNKHTILLKVFYSGVQKTHFPVRFF